MIMDKIMDKFVTIALLSMVVGLATLFLSAKPLTAAQVLLAMH